MGRSQGGVGRSQGGGVRSQRGGYSIHVCCRSHLGRRGPCEHTFHQDIWQLLKKYFHSATSCTNHSHLVKFGNAGTKNVSRICDFNQQSPCGRGCFTNRLVKVTCLLTHVFSLNSLNCSHLELQKYGNMEKLFPKNVIPPPHHHHHHHHHQGFSSNSG